MDNEIDHREIGDDTIDGLTIANLIESNTIKLNETVREVFGEYQKSSVGIDIGMTAVLYALVNTALNIQQPFTANNCSVKRLKMIIDSVEDKINGGTGSLENKDG